jgi:hypothetical protein
MLMASVQTGQFLFLREKHCLLNLSCGWRCITNLRPKPNLQLTVRPERSGTKTIKSNYLQTRNSCERAPLRQAPQRRPQSSLRGHPSQQILCFSLTGSFRLWLCVLVLPTHSVTHALRIGAGRSMVTIRHVDYFRARRDSGPSSSMLPTGPASSRLYCMAIPCECTGPLPNVEVTSLKLEWFMVELRRRR